MPPRPNRFITSWRALFFRCTTTIAPSFWPSCSTLLPSTDRSSTRNAWCSSTSPTRICADAAECTCQSRASSEDQTSRSSESAQPVLVHGHADGGIHSHLFQCGNLAPRFDTARGDNRMGSRVAQPAKPCEVRARHRAFAVHVGAQESRAEVFALGHHVQPRIPLEFPQQAEDSGDGKLALPPAN